MTDKTSRNAQKGSDGESRLKPYLEIGQIVGTHGVRGELRVSPWCDSPDFFKRFTTLYYDEKGTQAVQVLSSRPHGHIVLLCLEGVSGVETAAALRGKVLYMHRRDAKMPPGQFFVVDLIGCKVIDAHDESLTYGVLTDVSPTGANDVWHIKGANGKEYLLPVIEQVVIHTDVEAGIIKIRPLAGIFED
ncbi:MAG TPA: ribosome maturation factor RimM [Clostridia bacterium]|nr:ribosome maturation factor RimM [Clostridia bacterium]